MSTGLLLIPAIAFLVVGAFLLARVWPTWPSRLTVFGVALFGLLVLSFQALGVVAAALKAPAVRPLWLIVSSVGMCALSWRASRAMRSWAGLRDERDGSPAGRVSSNGPASCGQVSRSRPRRWLPAAIVGAVVLAVLPNAASLGLSAPPRGWDVLSYHMPKALAWLQNGNLGSYGSLAAFYPGNGEIAILFSLFTGTDALAPLVQLPFALLGAAAVYGLARELGARATSAAASAVVFLAAPIVLFQSALAKDDLVVTALVAAGVYLLLRSARARGGHRFSIVELGASGLAFGLALGVKYSVLPFVALSVVAVYLTRFRVVRSRRALPVSVATRSACRRTALFVVMLVLPSAFWFVQNWVVAGNPLAPLSFGMVADAFGRHDPRYVASALGWLVFPWLDRAVQGSYSASSGFGAAFATFAAPALALCGWLCVSRRARRHLRLPQVMVLAFVAGGVAAWWLGGHHLPRFLLPVVALACAPVALLFDRVDRGMRFALVGLLVLAVLFSTGEALRVIYAGDDLVSSHMGFVDKAEHYHMPGFIYELPAGTRILLIDIPGIDVFRTFRYPVAGDLPGNEVLMAGDIGFETDLVRRGPVLGHASLVREGVGYIFLRTLALPPGPTVFDMRPDLYEKVVDTVEEPYPWYRKGYLPTPGEGFDERAPAVTKVYRVLRG
ncbi:MAG: phospholipid carrier-dependent glycosyltransferase [Candidatus Eisenbacteria bacterium]